MAECSGNLSVAGKEASLKLWDQLAAPQSTQGSMLKLRVVSTGGNGCSLLLWQLWPGLTEPPAVGCCPASSILHSEIL